MTSFVAPETAAPGTTALARVGGGAALLAGILFRRNFGAEVALFSAIPQPDTVADWFALLQSHRLLALLYLNLVDLANYLLLALVFVALYAVLRRTAPASMAVALTLGLLGIAIFLATNTAFSMVALSARYAAATTAVERSRLLAAGQTALALNRFGMPGGHPGSGGWLSLLLVATAGLITAIVMLRSPRFNTAAAVAGIVAALLDLAYGGLYVLLPAVDPEQLALLFIPAAGLCLMVWHILLGSALLRLGRSEGPDPRPSPSPG